MSIILYPCIGIQEKKGPNPETSDPEGTELYVKSHQPQVCSFLSVEFVRTAYRLDQAFVENQPAKNPFIWQDFPRQSAKSFVNVENKLKKHIFRSNSIVHVTNTSKTGLNQ